MTRRALLKTLSAGLAIATIGSMAAQAQNMTALPERLALQGYDPVAYFTDAKAVPGVAAFEYAWDGQRYRFATSSHLNMFKADPEKYAPQFGGACTMNMSNGVRRESDPHNWVISNGRLYVFAGATGMERFRQNPAAAAERAEANWKNMKPAASQ